MANPTQSLRSDSCRIPPSQLLHSRKARPADRTGLCAINIFILLLAYLPAYMNFINLSFASSIT
jgi:hypothetical protein